MKKMSCLLASLLVLMFASCSSGTDPKEITPTSTEFTSGELAKYVQVVDEPCELTYAETNDAIPAQFIRAKVKLKLVKEDVKFKSADPQDIDFTGLLSVATINLVDESGTNVVDLSIKDEDCLKLKKLLTRDEGSTEEIVFEGSFHNSEDAPEWFKKTIKFTPYLTGDPSVDLQSLISDAVDSVASALTPALTPEKPETPAFDLANVQLPSSLKGKVEVIQADKKVGNYGYPKMTITFKLLKKVSTAPLCSDYGQMWLIGVGKDASGVNVSELLPNYKEWRSDDSDGSQFKNFLESEPGETITLEFTGDKDGSSNVEADLARVAKFKLSITK